MADERHDAAAQGTWNNSQRVLGVTTQDAILAAPTLQARRRSTSAVLPSFVDGLGLTRKALAGAARRRQSAGRQGRSMKLSLVVMTPGKMKGKEIPVPSLPFLIGRASNCQLRPTSPMISKLHCGLALENRKPVLNDFKSTNGTFLNDNKVQDKVEVRDGDVLKIGPLVFMVRVLSLPAVDDPTPVPPQMRKRGQQPAEDDIAALLLSGDGESAAPSSNGDAAPAPAPANAESLSASGTGFASPGQPTGVTNADTQMAITLPPEPAANGTPPSDANGNGAASASTVKEKTEPEKPKYGNTAEAAENILKMYMRRNRK